MAGEFDQVKGHVKEAAGEATGDEDLKAEGKVDRVAGKVKEKVGNVADAVKDKLRRDDQV